MMEWGRGGDKLGSKGFMAGSGVGVCEEEICWQSYSQPLKGQRLLISHKGWTLYMPRRVACMYGA